LKRNKEKRMAGIAKQHAGRNTDTESESAVILKKTPSLAAFS